VAERDKKLASITEVFKQSEIKVAEERQMLENLT